MRPEILFPLFVPAGTLPGVGPRIAEALARVAGEKVVDLLWHLPSGLIDRRYSPSLGDAIPGRVATLLVTVGEHAPPPHKRLPYKVHCHDDTGTLTLVFFHGKEDYLLRTLPPGSQRVISGMLERFGEGLQMSHPDHVVSKEQLDAVRTVEPVYPLTAGLAAKRLVKIEAAALEKAPDLPEWQDEEYLRRQGWPGWLAALQAAHAPQGEADLMPLAPPRARLAYDELLANQLALALIRARQRNVPGRPLKGSGELQEKVLASLSYELTNAQKQTLQEIAADLESPSRMLRLLQGDVGSGKTIVALLTMLQAIEAGAQAALVAPTEILARQHFETIRPLAETAGVQVELLTGRSKGKAREALLTNLADGRIHVLIGTHALFQEDVAFHDLGLVVVDEQHRFGVHQRLSLTGKGQKGRGAVNVLVMTATPIPRTLTLTHYGDMEVSRLTEKPPGRTPVETRVLPVEKLDQVIGGLRRATDQGARVYWVCPLVSESEAIDLAAAEERHAMLKRMLGDGVGLIHGRMKASEKDAVMDDFAAGRLAVLVATTVIEVGVDVPEATVMVIEHAERFGLAQLHQLRGRVGRGSGKSNCLLLYSSPLGETARARLNIMRETEDGFLIAEEDLRLRGAGEVLGTRQSGLPEFRLADLTIHQELLQTARDDSQLILRRDPELTGDRGKALRVLLYLFERDGAVAYLRSG
jgi:ATP-dependent DNA helicase RecG